MRALYVGCLALLAAGLGAGTASAAPVPTSGGPAAHLSTVDASKGRPPPVGGASTAAPRANAAGTVFLYAAERQSVTVDGAWGYYTIARPTVATGDSHSLAELAVQSADGRQIVEVGWTVDPGLNGDANPHLFVFHWVDGVPTCYNGCGFVPRNEPGYTAGMTLPVTSTAVQFSILHHGTEWLVGYNGHWVGAYPDTLWTNTYKVGGLVQWFGEVAAAGAASCSQMGNGQFAGSPTAAAVTKIGFWPGERVAAVVPFVTSPGAYDLSGGSAGFRFGGPGACRTVPSVLGLTPDQATTVLAAAGLVTGVVGTVADPGCDHLDLVLKQTPAAGSRLPAGSAVGFSYGVKPRNGCPIVH